MIQIGSLKARVLIHEAARTATVSQDSREGCEVECDDFDVRRCSRGTGVGLGGIAYNKGRSIARPAPHCAWSRLQS